MEEKRTNTDIEENNTEEQVYTEENNDIITDEEINSISDILTSDDDIEIESEDIVNANIIADYLKSIGHYRVLEHEEEVELSNKIQLGLAAKKALEEIDIAEENDENRDLITKTLLELQETMRAGEEAKQKLINHNLKLVVSRAKKYKCCKCDMLDLIQEGNIGLITATEKYDPSKGTKFSTYATLWIKQGITRYIMNTSNTIRVPVHAMEKALKVNKIINELTLELGREPLDEEVAARLNIPVASVETLRLMTADLISLDSSVNNADGDTDTTFGDFLHDDTNALPEDTVLAEDMKNALMEVLGGPEFMERDRKVLYRRFGLEGFQPMTLEEVGKEFNVTRERIRQIEARAIRKLRKPKYSYLKKYLYK